MRVVAALLVIACSSPRARPDATAEKAAVVPIEQPTEKPIERPVTADAAPRASRLVVASDRRIELVSILYHVAGVKEYQGWSTPYAKDVDEYFGPFRQHPAVRSSAGLRTKWGIGYEAPISLFVYLDVNLQPIRALDPLPPGVTASWATAPIDVYLEEVRDFAAKTKFDAFYDAHAEYRNAVEARLRGALDGHPILEWFDTVFGARPMATYQVVPGYLAGGRAVGVSATREDGIEDLYQVMFLENIDADGLPRPTATTREYLVHELSHPYVNPLFARRWADVAEPAVAAFALVEAKMKKSAYTTPEIMVNESVVRALTVLYLRERAPDEAEASMKVQIQVGFVWMEALVAALEEIRGRNQGALPEDELVAATAKVLADAR